MGKTKEATSGIVLDSREQQVIVFRALGESLRRLTAWEVRGTLTVEQKEEVDILRELAYKLVDSLGQKLEPWVAVHYGLLKLVPDEELVRLANLGHDTYPALELPVSMKAKYFLEQKESQA